MAFAELLGHGRRNGFQALHRRLLAKAAGRPGCLAGATEASEMALVRRLGLRGCFARVPEGRREGDVDPVGAAFLDILGEKRPFSLKLRNDMKIDNM